MASPATRHRRAFAPPPSHAHAYPDTTTPTHTPSPTQHPLALLPRWRQTRTSAATPLALRASMRLLEVFLLALALFIVPACIQPIVRALDAVYEAVGRRAVEEVSWMQVGVGGGVLAAWHVLLILVSERAMADGKRGGAWSRVLGRGIVPGYLVVALGGLFCALATRRAAPHG
ncbi:hypothetical protein P171DRAFT_479495 [Karstenula rhodostoma CBS 690.94]|uniref:Uncharacterized protein n=1 Tax=Karstenula rhodostoma CBS 690.94 TaxID=1392251 RepID=A0A9P4PUA8_9PLEO|nr:hypothetical protein P171DRAFT_479495 [Karstenula rhodostoma CBS 690.94]